MHDRQDPTSNTEKASWWPTLIVVGLFLLIAAPMIALQHDRGRGRFDQLNYHEPAVLRFAEQWPTPDVSDYLSATTPAYHLVLAVVARFVSPSPVALQATGALFTVGLLVVFTRWLSLTLTRGRQGVVTATLLGLSLIASLYVFSAGVYILPDNAAWLGVLGILLLALRPRADLGLYLGGGAILLALVLTRQSHLWALGVLFASAWLGSAFEPKSSGFHEIGALLTRPALRLSRLAVMILCALPALGALLWFARLWGGLTVPIYHDYMKGPNPATPAIILAQMGVIGAFHVGFWWRGGVTMLRERRGVLALALIGGLAVLVGPATTYDRAAGRYSGLWNLLDKAPDLAGHTNLGVLVLGVAGVVAITGWLAGLDARRRWILLGALVAFAAAVSVPKNAWTRYHEPMLLMWGALASASAVARVRASDRERFVRTLGLIGLVVFLSGITVIKLSTEERIVVPKQSQPSIETPLRSLWPDAWKARWADDTAGPGAGNDAGD